MKKIGIVGLGIMPKGMARNFLKNNYEIYLWNRTKSKADSLVKDGANWCVSPAEVAKNADIIIECVSDDEASRDVWLGDQGILAAASKDTVLITAASLSLDWTNELAQLCKDKGFKFLDMPLTGSRPGAEGGKLKLLVGGDKKVLESIRPELSAISDTICYFGSSGAGMRFKLILNTLAAIQIDAMAQGLAMAEKAGLKKDDVYKAIFDTPMGPSSPAAKMVFSSMDLPDDYPNFATKWIEKDLRYTQAMAKQLSVDFDLLNDTQKNFQKAKENGLADQDWAKIFKQYQ